MLVMTLLCIAGAGLASAAFAPIFHRSSVVRLMMSSRLGSRPTITVPGLSRPPLLTSPPRTSPAPAAATAQEPSLADQVTVAAEVTRAAQAVLPNMQVAFEIFDRTQGTVLISQGGDRPFAAMSVVKLLIALDALARDNSAIQGGLRQDLHQMLATSDDEIADDLWTAGGGPAIVTRMVSLLGLTGARPPEDPGMWGDTLITAQDMVTVYRYITDQLNQPEQDLILGALSDAPKIAADGFNQYFGIPNGMPNTSWAVKQGWGTSGSQAVMNTTGLVGPGWRYVVVLLASAPANSYSAAPAAVTAGAAELANLVSATS